MATDKIRYRVVIVMELDAESDDEAYAHAEELVNSMSTDYDATWLDTQIQRSHTAQTLKRLGF